MAFQTTADGINLWRFISAIGLGIELVTVDAYLSELVPKAARGKAFAFLLGDERDCLPVTYFLAWQLMPHAPFGYEAGVGWCLSARSRCRRLVDPAWPAREPALARPAGPDRGGRARHGRDRGAGRRRLRPAAAGARAAAYQDPRKGSLVEIFSPRYRRRTIMLMLFNFFQTVGFYGFVAWTPTLLIAKGIHVTQSLEYSTIIKSPRWACRSADHAVRRPDGAQMARPPVVPVDRGVRHLVSRSGEYVSALIVLGACLAMSTAVALLRAA